MVLLMICSPMSILAAESPEGQTQSETMEEETEESEESEEEIIDEGDAPSGSTFGSMRC